MLYSEKHKFVFVAVPKTGTTAIQKRLREIDPSITRNHVKNAAGEMVHMPTHSTAQAIRSVMGDRADEYTFIAFLRDPRAVLVSKYHFYRSGRAAQRQGLASGSGGIDSIRFKPATALRVIMAKMLPIRIWANLYPYAPSANFVTDTSGNLIVDRIGLTERLQGDVDEIFADLGYNVEELQLGTTANRTEYDRSQSQDHRIADIVERRLPQDCSLYKRIQILGSEAKS